MSVVDDYLKTLDPPQKAELSRVQTIIEKHVPQAEACITYGMPGYKYNKKYLVAFAAFKNHMSLFPGGEAVEMLGDKLEGYKTSRGTVQFTLEKPLPTDLIIALLDARLAGIAKV